MNLKLPEQQKYDPWEIKQEITDINVILHCSRYWMLSEWECENMSFPFWRLYHSRSGGSYVCFEEKEVQLLPDKIVLIPPFTPFSTYIKRPTKHIRERIKGLKINIDEEVEHYQKQGLKDQLFIHFNLGFPYDNYKPDIYEIEINDCWLEIIKTIEVNRLLQPNSIDFQANVKINCLILYSLQTLDPELWRNPNIDARILKTINFIENNISNKLSNNDLGNQINLATNSFTRLFSENMNCSVQQYIQQRRIISAIMLLHHSELGIKEIAFRCGFFDRHHFSKIFKQRTGTTPIRYREKIRKQEQQSI